MRGGTRQLTIRVGSLGASLAARAGESGLSEAQVAKRDLIRYYALITIGMEEVKQLDVATLREMCEATVAALGTGTESASVAKVVEQLSPAGRYALLDVLERMAAQGSDDPIAALTDLLR